MRRRRQFRFASICTFSDARSRHYPSARFSRLLAHDREHRADRVRRANEADGQLAVELLQRQLLEEARVEAGRIVDQDVDAAKPFRARCADRKCT